MSRLNMTLLLAAHVKFQPNAQYLNHHYGMTFILQYIICLSRMMSIRWKLIVSCSGGNDSSSGGGSDLGTAQNSLD